MTPFVSPDEFILLCDMGQLTTDELCVMREAGIRTAVELLSWPKIEPSPGVYDWSELDATLAHCQAADLKVLLRCEDGTATGPLWGPDDWYLRSTDGAIWRNHGGYGGNIYLYTLLSPWCREAMQAEREFLLKCIARYASPTVQLYPSGPHGGEVILPGMIACYCDEHALADFRDYAEREWQGNLAAFNKQLGSDWHDWSEVLPADLPEYPAMQLAPTTVNWLANSLYNWVRERNTMFPELWLSLVERRSKWAEIYEAGPRTGNWLARTIYKDLPGELSAPLNLLYWEIYRLWGTEGALDNVIPEVTWVGSQYMDGLYAFTDIAIRAGLRGFISGPLHTYEGTGTLRLDDWQPEAVRWSLKRWQAARL